MFGVSQTTGSSALTGHNTVAQRYHNHGNRTRNSGAFGLLPSGPGRSHKFKPVDVYFHRFLTNGVG